MRRRLLIWILFALVALPWASTAQASRDFLFHQGLVFDQGGNPLEGSLNVTFRIYETPSGGDPVWEETQNLTFDKGIFTAELGSQTPMDTEIFNEETLFLSVQIEGDVEMSPRVGLFSVPWSQQAEVAVTALSLANNIVTSGSVAPGSIESSDIANGAIGAPELASTAVTAGTYTLATITVDADGRITAASNGSIPAVSVAASSLTGTLTDLQVPNNITIDLATAATALAGNGTNCSAGSYALGVDASGAAEGCTVAGTGTVTSVGTGTGLTGGTITSSGTVSLDYSATLAGNPTLANNLTTFGSTGIIFEGATGGGADNNEGLLTATDPTADRTWTLPDVSGTVALTTSNVSSATALAANGTNCSAGSYSLGVDASGNAEGCTAAGTGTITGVTAGTGLTGGGSSGSVTLNVDVGTTAGKIVQLDGSAALPAVSGTNLTSLPAGSITGTISDSQVSDTLTIGASGSVAASAISGALTDSQVPNNITIDLATAATALAGNGTNCSAGSYSLGVDGSGNAEGCTATTDDVRPKVVNVTDTTSQSLTDTDELITDSNPSITPTSTTSRVMVTVSVNLDADGNDDEVNVFKVWRNSSCSGTQVGGDLKTFTTNNTEFATVSTTFVDSPSSTSAVTYALCHDNDATGTVSNDTVTVTITLMEIAP